MTDQTREPEIFTAGDTLRFVRAFADYPAGEGWVLTYKLTSLAGAEVASAAATAEGDAFRVEQNDFADGLPHGDYILTGSVELPGARYTLYTGVLTIGDNLPDGQGVGSQKTQAQEMIEILDEQLKALYKQQFQETDVQRSRFVMQKQSEVRKELLHWQEVRRWEVMSQNVRNGKPSGAVTMPILNVG